MKVYVVNVRMSTEKFGNLPANYVELFKNKELKGNHLTIGSIQMGKTLYLLYKALYLYYYENLNVVIITHPSLKEQFKERFKKINVSLKINIIEENKKLKATLSDNCRKILVIGSHFKNIDALVKHWPEKKKFYVLLDEGDLYNNPADVNFKQNKVSISIAELKSKSCCAGSDIVTATPYSYMYIKDKYPVSAKNITFLEKPQDYISYGHDKFIVETIENNLQEINDNNVFCEELTKIVIQAKQRFGKTPIRMYVNVTENVDSGEINQTLVKNVLKHIYDTSGDPCSFIIANNSKYVYINETEYECESMSQAMIVYRKKNSNRDLFIISCRQTGRGHSLRTVEKDFSINNIIYANCALFCTTGSSSTDSIIQQALRIGGRFPGHETIEDFKLVLYTTKDVLQKIETQYKEDEINYKNFKENPEKYLTELIRPTKTEINKPISASRGTYFQKKIGDEYVQTEDTAGVQQETEPSTINYNKTDLSEKILNILKSKNNMTVKQLSEITIWSEIVSKTPSKTISTACIRMHRAKMLTRTRKSEKGPFVYSVPTTSIN